MHSCISATMTSSIKTARVESFAEILEMDSEPQEDQSDEIGASDGEESEASTRGSDEEESSEERSDDGEKEAGDGEHAGDEEGDKEGTDGNKKAEEGIETDANAGWAEVMAKILLKKTPESKPCILLKNKQVDKRKEKERKAYLERKKQADTRRVREMMCREKPDIVKDRENERNLQRIATRGVVQLFNAVRMHQKTVDEKVKEAGGSERKKAKLLSSVSKKDFINVLRGTDGVSGVTNRTDRQTAGSKAEEKPSWSVLKDDYMMGASMKDWDKASDAEEDDPQARDVEDCSESD
ncbi:hypothetical protein DPEC_G00354460 [Dallia pectoralis]|uniref:Uncharacterized protein n=1 Tax=Dallia pectoralis TaxID=75939 RepID=A0ACC2F2T3_DALPE|nr:hypothetical protein DPEC_G00354460 [Dallia pectoralis]